MKPCVDCKPPNFPITSIMKPDNTANDLTRTLQKHEENKLMLKTLNRILRSKVINKINLLKTSNSSLLGSN